MGVSLYRSGTEYVANAITIGRGTVNDITSVGVFHSTDPAVVPTLAQFTAATLVKPGDPLSSGTGTDVLSLIGPRGGITLAPGVYQRWVRISTATEDVVRKLDTLEVL